MDPELRQMAKSHLQQAHDFLDGAEANFELGTPRAAGSNAILAGIRAKDAIAIATLGTTSRTQDHRTALRELRSALIGRREANSAERALSDLLTVKTDLQYSAKGFDTNRIETLLRRARTLVSLADEIVSQAI